MPSGGEESGDTSPQNMADELAPELIAMAVDEDDLFVSGY